MDLIHETILIVANSRRQFLHEGELITFTEHIFEDRTLNGVLRPFSHLRSFDMVVRKEARGDLAEFQVTVRVVFDCHVVTESADEFIVGDPHYWKDRGGKSRRFDEKRYQYSIGLPNLISGLPVGKIKCYVANKNNYMVWEPAGSEGEHYQVFFELSKPAKQQSEGGPLLLLYVQSAYVKDAPFAKQRERFQSFGQICAQLAGAIPAKSKGPRSKKK